MTEDVNQSLAVKTSIPDIQKEEMRRMTLFFKNTMEAVCHGDLELYKSCWMCQNHKVLIILLPSVRVTSQYWEYTTANPEKWCNTSQYVPHSLVKHMLPPDTADLLTASHESGGFHTSRVFLLWHARTCRHRGALCIILGPEAQGTSTTMLKLLFLRLL